MSFTAVFKSVLKRTNSTQVPNMQVDSTTLSIVVLDATSVMNPRIRLSYSGNPTSWNYCMISEFGRYYFVTDWTSDHNQWIATLKCDVLATYKTTILASSEYVLRSASDSDGNITDSYYPAYPGKNSDIYYPQQYFTEEYDPLTDKYYPLKDVESYIVGIYGTFDVSDWGGDATAYANYVTRHTRGSITYYWLTRGQLVALINYLTSDNSLANYGITDISTGGQKALINPLQYISSILAVPIVQPLSPDPETTMTMNFKYGWFDIPVSSIIPGTNYLALFRMDKLYSNENIYHSLNCLFDIRNRISTLGGLHSQASDRGYYLNRYPYTQIHCVYEPFGEFDLDTSIIPVGTNGFYFQVELEPIQGIGILTVFPITPDFPSGQFVDKRYILARVEAQIGVEVSVNQLAVNNLQTVTSMIGSTVGAVSSAISGNVGGVIANASSGIRDMIESQYPSNQTKGTNGTTFSRYVDGPIMWIRTIGIVPEDNEHLGRPLCRKVTLSTLSGYCMTRDADIKISGTTSEADEIKTLMDGGFYIE